MASTIELLAWLSVWTCLPISVHAGRGLPATDLSVLGPVYLPPSSADFQAFADAKTRALAAIQDNIASGYSSYGLVDNQTTSFSVQVFSSSFDEPLLDYHFEAPGLAGSTNATLSENTVYRSGSIGKLMTMYVWMVDIGDEVFLDPVVKYVPELEQASQSYENPLWSTNWSEVTIGALASQLSGIGRDVNFGDYALPVGDENPEETAITNGFPPLSEDAMLQCSNIGVLPRCDRAQFFEGITKHPPVHPSYTTPAYSNIAYAILALAYENITGRSMEAGHSAVFNERLGMKSTTYSLQPGADAIIPHNDTFAGYSDFLGLIHPAGGQYFSAKDLRRWGSAILNSELVPDVVTRRWMKPYSLTSQWEGAVGAPWEIYRQQVASNDALRLPRLVDTYSKSGDIGLYTTYFGLVEDYNMGISVLAAGDNHFTQMQVVRNTVVDVFYEAAEAAAKEQARRAFIGTFKSSQINSTITLDVDSGPGVVITHWVSNGTNFLENALLGSSNDFRLFPTKLSIEDAVLTWYKYQMSALPNHGEPQRDLAWSESNARWIWGDSVVYGNRAAQAFIVGFDANGIVQSVGSQALRCNMTRGDD